MKKIFSIVLIICLLVVSLSSCAVPEEDRNLGGREALNRITNIRGAEELYVGTSESHYLDDTYVSKIENSAYSKKNMSVMWHYEDNEDEGESESYIRTIGKSENTYGDFDFKGEFGNSYANSFITSTTDALISILQSDVFDSQENEDGFVMVCNDRESIEKSNLFIYDALEDGTSLADALGDNIKYSLVIEFIKNDYDGLNVISTTTIEGSEHKLEILKIMQFMLNDEGLNGIKDEIIKMKFDK